MTGEKNRIKTTEKLWNLDDKQLKTPKHDAMVLWLMDKVNLLLSFPFEPEVEVERRYNKPPEIAYFRKVRIDTEYPLYSNKNFIGGYVDIIATGMYAFEDMEEPKNWNRKFIEVKPYIDSFGAVLRQIKNYQRFIFATDYNRVPLNFSSGAAKRTEFFIFSFDDRFDSQFESQGVTVVHPPSDVTIEDMVNEFGLGDGGIK